MTKAEFYDKTMVLALKEQGLDDEDIMQWRICCGFWKWMRTTGL